MLAHAGVLTKRGETQATSSPPENEPSFPLRVPHPESSTRWLSGLFTFVVFALIVIAVLWRMKILKLD